MKAAARKTSFRRAIGSAFRVVAFSLLGALGLGGFLAYRGYKAFESDLPTHLDVVTDYRPLRASQILSADGEVIGEFFVEKRVLVPVGSIPPLCRRAFVAAEDARFYRHGGVDWQGIARAAVANFRAGRVVQGGSSITQQVAKLLIIGQERSLARKVREAMLAYRIEKRLTKDQILGVYLNHVYLGHGAYGIAAAAAAYFGKTVDALSPAEAAMLAGLPKAPGRATPLRDFARAQARQHYVIDQMLELGFLTPEAAEDARREPLVLVSRERALSNVAAPYFVETIRRYVAEHYGDEELVENGLRIHTTLDMRRQRAAEAALRSGLEDLQRRLGFSGPIGRLDTALRKRLGEGRPRPFGPAGFEIDEAEGEDLVVAGAEPPAAVVDATATDKAGGRLSEDVARYYFGEARFRDRQQGGNRPAEPRKPPRSALPFATDPDLVYAAVVTGLGRKLTLASGALAATLDPADEARAMAWTDGTGARIQPGDVLPVRFHVVSDRRGDRAIATLAEAPGVQGALIALDPRDGHLVSMVGGYDYAKSQFNRAVQARRQIGSAIKPFVYAAAIEKGMTELTIKWDVPVKFRTASGIWAPHNYKREFLGPLTLRTALAKSINTVSAQLCAQMGVDAVIDVMRRLGIASKLPHAMALSLGAADLGLQEVAYAMASFPAGGAQVAPVSILRLADVDGRVLEDHAKQPASRPRRLDPETAYIVTDLLRGVVEIGTGRKAKDLGRPAAGKTGTSTNYRDAWFVGFTPDLLCAVWIGRDDFKPIGHDVTGGQVAAPIWLAYMREALRGEPVRTFEPPPGIVFARADPDKGLPATPGKAGSRLTPFRRGSLPPAFRTGAPTGRFADTTF